MTHPDTNQQVNNMTLAGAIVSIGIVAGGYSVRYFGPGAGLAIAIPTALGSTVLLVPGKNKYASPSETFTYSPDPEPVVKQATYTPPSATVGTRVAVSRPVPGYVEREIAVDPNYQPKPIRGSSLAIELLEAEIAEKEAREREERQHQLENRAAAHKPSTAPIETPKPEQEAVEPSTPRTAVERAIIKAIRKRTKQGKSTTLRDLVGLAFAKKHDLRASGELRDALDPLLADGTLRLEDDQYLLA